jgi:pimeloyl-ACP methyl ester carboxylesterase
MQKRAHSSLNTSQTIQDGYGQSEFLFLHGRYGTSEVWKPLARSFKNSIYFDYTNQGCSLSELVENVSKYIKAQKRNLILIGHDFGSTVAQLTALQLEKPFPQLISGLILINSCSLSGIHVPRWRWRVLRKLEKLLKARVSSKHREIIQSHSHASLLELSESWPVEEELNEIRKSMHEYEKPILLLWGSLDELNPPSLAHEIMLSYPDVELFQHDQAGHWPWLDDPEWVLAKIKEFTFRTRLPTERAAS